MKPNLPRGLFSKSPDLEEYSYASEFDRDFPWRPLNRSIDSKSPPGRVKPRVEMIPADDLGADFYFQELTSRGIDVQKLYLTLTSKEARQVVRIQLKSQEEVEKRLPLMRINNLKATLKQKFPGLKLPTAYDVEMDAGDATLTVILDELTCLVDLAEVTHDQFLLKTLLLFRPNLTFFAEHLTKKLKADPDQNSYDILLEKRYVLEWRDSEISSKIKLSNRTKKNICRAASEGRSRPITARLKIAWILENSKVPKEILPSLETLIEGEIERALGSSTDQKIILMDYNNLIKGVQQLVRIVEETGTLQLIDFQMRCLAQFFLCKHCVIEKLSNKDLQLLKVSYCFALLKIDSDPSLLVKYNLAKKRLEQIECESEKDACYLNFSTFFKDPHREDWNVLKTRKSFIDERSWNVLKVQLTLIFDSVYKEEGSLESRQEVKQNVLAFFDKTMKSSDAKMSPVGRKTVRLRVASLIDFMVEKLGTQDAQKKQQAIQKAKELLSIFNLGGTACVDRTIVALSDAEIHTQLMNAKGNFISNILVNRFKLNAINVKLIDPDDREGIELYLYLILRLNEVFDLGVSTNTMWHESCVKKKPFRYTVSKVFEAFTAEELIGYIAGSKTFRATCEKEIIALVRGTVEANPGMSFEETDKEWDKAYKAKAQEALLQAGFLQEGNYLA